MQIRNARRRATMLWVVAALLPITCSPATEVAEAPEPLEAYWPTADWRVAQPRDAGMDAGLMADLAARAGRTGEIDAVIVVRNGYIVLEEYFNGWRADRPHTLQSVSKSVTSLIVGTAVTQGQVSGADANVLSFFTNYPDLRNVDERKRALTLRDLLTMRTGLDWSEDNYSTSPLRQLNESRGDWLRLVLDWPMREMPGTRFQYNSGGVIVLGGVVRSATGQSPDDYAQQHLFGPLGISSEFVRWAHSPYDNLPHTGGGLYLTPRDVAKLGLLVLHEGEWEDRQIVSRAWIEASTRQQTATGWTFGARSANYGYLWWLFPPARNGGLPVITGSGTAGQWLFIDRASKTIAVFAGSAAGYNGFIAPVELFYSHVMPAVR